VRIVLLDDRQVNHCLLARLVSQLCTARLVQALTLRGNLGQRVRLEDVLLLLAWQLIAEQRLLRSGESIVCNDLGESISQILLVEVAFVPAQVV